jgi:hypothetical protein
MAALNKAAVGLPNVDNTSDLNKPISTLTQNALNTKMNRLTSTYTVGDASADFLTIQAAVTWLSTGGNMFGNTALHLGAGIHTITDTVTINLPYTLIIQGSAFDITIINAATGLFNKPMFSVQTACNFDSFRMYATTLLNYGDLATENGINIIGNSLYCEIKNIGLYGFYDGILNVSNSELWLVEDEILDCKHDGINLNSASAGSRLSIYMSVFSGNVNACINLVKGSSTTVIVSGLIIDLTATQKGVLYDGANFLYTNISIKDTIWNKTGTLFSGFDFTRVDGRDANIELLNNNGTENKVPHAYLSILNNTATTTVTTANTYYKAVITAGTQSFYNCKAKVETNKVTYQPLASRDGNISICANVLCNNSNRTVNIAIVKNGAVVNGIYGQMSVRVTVQNQAFAVSMLAYIEDLSYNDYFEIWVTSSNSGDVVTVQDVNAFFNS